MDMTNIPSAFAGVIGQISLDDIHIKQAFEYYQQRYRQSESAQRFVQYNCRIDDGIRNNTIVGFCDRTMGKNIPKRKSPEGAAICGSLQRCGLVRSTGHELFRGCVMFPVYDESDEVISAIGYRIGRIRQGDKTIVYWNKPEPKCFVDVGMSLAKELIREQAYH